MAGFLDEVPRLSGVPVRAAITGSASRRTRSECP